MLERSVASDGSKREACWHYAHVCAALKIAVSLAAKQPGKCARVRARQSMYTGMIWHESVQARLRESVCVSDNGRNRMFRRDENRRDDRKEVRNTI